MRHKTILSSVLLAMLLITGSMVFAQSSSYNVAGAPSILRTQIQSGGLQVFLNNVLVNIYSNFDREALLEQGISMEFVQFTSTGFPIVSIGRTQPALPIIMSNLPAGSFRLVTFGLEEVTTFSWVVRPLPNGLLLTELPVYLLPPGEYILQFNEVDFMTLVIPANYAPAPYTPPQPNLAGTGFSEGDLEALGFDTQN